VKKNLIIVVLGFLVYIFSFSNGFVWDDEVFIQGISSPQSSLAGAYFRPAASAIYSTIYNIFGPKPFFFHFFQLIFHIAAAVLIFYLFKKFFKETIALILALVFLVHPASVEAVSFASAMQEVAFTLMGLAGLYLFINSENISVPKSLFATFLLIISLLMKETAIVFFPLVFCYLLLFRRKQPKTIINYSIFTTVLLMAYLLVRISSGSLYVQGPGLFPIMRVSLMTRLINIPSIILYYLGKFIFPVNLAIAQQWVIHSIDFNHFFLPLIIEVVLFLGAVFYILKKKNKIFTFFFLWFLIGLLPHLQLVPLNMTVAERWLYFPMIGLLGMIGSVLGKSKIVFIILIAIITIFSIRSFVRTLDWHSGLSLYNRDIKKDSSFDLQNNFGVELFRVGKFNQAKKYFEISVKLAPYWWVNWNNLGVVYEHEKNYKKATEYYEKSISNGQYYLAYENLAKILVLHSNDKKKAKEFLEEALRIFPTDKNLQQINLLYLK
jgi:protein O-mannosyl-transferase